jgi:hypothetical protein
MEIMSVEIRMYKLLIIFTRINITEIRAGNENKTSEWIRTAKLSFEFLATWSKRCSMSRLPSDSIKSKT